MYYQCYTVNIKLSALYDIQLRTLKKIVPKLRILAYEYIKQERITILHSPVKHIYNYTSSKYPYLAMFFDPVTLKVVGHDPF